MNEESKIVYESSDKKIKILQGPDNSFFALYNQDFTENAMTFLRGFEACYNHIQDINNKSAPNLEKVNEIFNKAWGIESEGV